MEKTRTLPPLVRGRVTGVLDIFVEEIRLRNIFLSVDDVDLILQVQWWGEDSPTYIRPQKGCCQQARIKTGFDLVETARYEIKTTSDLFKLYLETSEALELCVVDAVDDCIIGSAFLKDLVNLLNKRDEIIKLPVFNYLGEEIGEVLVVFSFSQESWQNNEEKQGDMTVNQNKYRGKSDEQDLYVTKKTKEDYPGSFPLPEKISFHNRNKLISTEDLTGNKDMLNDIWKSNYFGKVHDDVADCISLDCQKLGHNIEKVGKSEKYSCLPEITVSSDSSKVLYFGLNSQKSKVKSNKNPKTSVTNKFNSNSIKFKSKKKIDDFPIQSSVVQYRKESKKNSGSLEKSNSLKKPSKIKEVKQSMVSVANKAVQSNELFNYQTPVMSISSKESLKSKVLDYLLGSDLSKEDEESAVSEFKKMSPSHDLVTSINKLCLTSDSDSFKSENKHGKNSVAFIQSHCLNFNLNNPIERNYYEKFFLKSNPTADLELAEFLNQPENRYVLDKLKTKESSQIKGSLSNSSCKSSKVSLCEKETQKLGSEEKLLEEFSRANLVKDCEQCKYHKKLKELDTIIESLKHFEKKLLSHEKDLSSKLEGNSYVMSSRNKSKDS